MSNNYHLLLESIKSFINEKCIKFMEPMKNHTTFNVGGPCDIMIFIEHDEYIPKLITRIVELNINYLVLGGGSNLLVRDKGYRGVIINLTKLNKMVLDGNVIRVSSGVKLCEVSKFANEHSLTGFEFACGIPGTIGGAVAMNAGAYGGEMSDVIKKVRVVDEFGNILELSNNNMEFSYRSTIVIKNKYTVIECDILLEKGIHKEISGFIEDLTFRRESKQPLEFPSAGSTFKRPEGYFAGKLIDDSGLRGFIHKNAMVSQKHCGFIINRGNATATEILELIEIVQDKVYKNFSVKLELEVRVIGEE